MTQRADMREGPAGRVGGIGWRWIAGLVVLALIVLFIAMNRDETNISFIVFDAETALWVALSVAAAGGLVAGFLLGRHRYRG